MPNEKVSVTTLVLWDCNGQRPASMRGWGIQRVVITCLFR